MRESQLFFFFFVVIDNYYRIIWISFGLSGINPILNGFVKKKSLITGHWSISKQDEERAGTLPDGVTMYGCASCTLHNPRGHYITWQPCD